MNSTIGSRLREARTLLGLDQSEMAKRLGIPRNSLHRYEADEQAPGGKLLAKAAEIGIDVAYVLAGGKRLDVSITPRELTLVDRYRLSPPVVQAGIDALLAVTAKTNDET